MAQCQGVVRPPSFDGMDLEPGALHADLNVAHAIELALRETAAVDELGAHCLLQALRFVGNAMVREQRARTQDTPVGRQVDRVQMREHSSHPNLL